MCPTYEELAMINSKIKKEEYEVLRSIFNVAPPGCGVEGDTIGIVNYAKSFVFG